MKLRTVFFALILLVSLSSAMAWHGKVVGITDGDSLTVFRDDQGPVSLRLSGIDAPEISQNYGAIATQALSELTFGKRVEIIEPTESDCYGRTVGKVMANGQDVNEAMIMGGMAWLYHRYCKEQPICGAWAGLEKEAKAAKLGLWSEPSPTPPWEWRHRGEAQQITSTTIVIAESGIFHGNARSGVFHRSECEYYNCPNCVVVFKSRNAAIQAGYRPCLICKP